jgi:hypothetical protein
LDPSDVFVFPASFAQQRLWFVHQLSPESPAYNIPAAFRLRGPLRVEVLRRSLDEIVRRHETLRSTIGARDGQPMQVITEALSVGLPVEDLADVPAPEREARAQALALEEASRPFSLSEGPLVRARLFRLLPDDHFFVLNIHHIVSDGWSLGVLSKELTALYAAFAADKPSPLPELPIQYADYVLWQRDWVSGGALAPQIEYWKKTLAGEPAILAKGPASS